MCFVSYLTSFVDKVNLYDAVPELFIALHVFNLSDFLKQYFGVLVYV